MKASASFTCTACVLLLSVLATGLESQVTRKPQDVVVEFYTARVRNRQGGLPDGAELERIAPLLSTRLHSLIVAVHRYRDEWVKQHPDKPGVNGGPPIINKPPFVGGDFFTSNVEGARSFKVSRTVRGPKGTWTVYVRFWYEAGLEGWEDAVVVITERGSYRIDDVLFPGDEPAHPRGRLSAILRQRDPD